MIVSLRHKTIGGIDLAYVDEGRGRALLLVHGFPLDHRMWSAQIAELSADYRVIAPDLRGFGQSAPGDGIATMRQLADDLADLLIALDLREPVVLAGLSMGGYIAFEFVRHHRDRLRALILCDTRAGVDTAEAAAGRQQMATRLAAEGTAFLVDAMLPKLLAPTTLAEQPARVELMRKMILENRPEGVAAAARGMAGRSDSTSLLPSMDLPVLLVVGQDDVLSPPGEMRLMASHLPQARLVEIPLAGHMSPLENPAAVNAAMRRFLASL